MFVSACKFILIVSVVLIASCGGGGGGGSSASGTEAGTTLVSSVQNISTSTMTVGNASAASGVTEIVLLDRVINFFKALTYPFVDTAFASNIGSCSSSTSQLIGSQTLRSWSVMSLTTSSSSSCVNSFQDAGNYIVLATTGVTDSSGNICDLVVITKASGNTSCINLPLTNRGSTGNPLFLLGPNSFPTAQLTANGNYFFVGFYTNNSSAAYIGFERIDFSGSSPSGSIAYLEYGTQVSQCMGTPSVNGHNLFWSSYWAQENGNFTFDQFNPIQCSSSPATGISKYYYVDVNGTTDPLNPALYLFDQHTVTTSGAYEIDNSNSPLGVWIQSLIAGNSTYQTWQNSAGTHWYFGAEVLPGGSTSVSDLSFYIVVGNGSGSLPNTCSTSGTNVYGTNSGINGNELIKVTISNSQVNFQDFGATNIGTGYGANPVTDNVYLTGGGQYLNSVHWTADTNSNLSVMKITRQLSASQCDSYSLVSPTTPLAVPTSLSGNISVVGNGNFVAHAYPFTYRSKDYIYMYSFNSNPGDPNCTSTSGCTIPGDAQIWAYNKSTDTITVVPITQLTGGGTIYYSTQTISNPLSNKISNTMIDASGNKYWSSIGTSGVQKLIQFPSGFNNTNGFSMGTN